MAGVLGDARRGPVVRLALHHWFWLLLPLLVLVSSGLWSSRAWTTPPRMAECVTLVDWCIIVPVLFALCYRDWPVRSLALRCLALSCAGFWLAGWIVPQSAQVLVSKAGSIRGIGMIVLAVLEAAAMLAVVRTAFASEPDPQVLQRLGVPPLVVRLMLAEARFWRRIWTQLRGR